MSSCGLPSPPLMSRCLCRAAGRHRCWGLERSCLRSAPWPHDGTILVQTFNVERNLCLVRESHRDGVTVHGVGAPRAGLDRLLPPPPRTFGLRHTTALHTLCRRRASYRLFPRNISRLVREQAHAPAIRQWAAGHNEETE